MALIITILHFLNYLYIKEKTKKSSCQTSLLSKPISLAELYLVLTQLLKQSCKEVACWCLFGLPLPAPHHSPAPHRTPPALGKTACSAARSHKINTGKGVGGLGGELSEALGSTSGRRSTRIATGSKVYSGFNFTF